MSKSNPEELKPLFLPVSSEVFSWYEGNKHWEIRRYGNWNERTLIPWRDILVSKGYSGRRWRGYVGSNVVGTLDFILENVKYDEIIPLVDLKEEEARSMILALLKGSPNHKYVAFEVERYWV